MIDIQMKELEEKIAAVKNSIGPNESSKLFSLTKKIENKDPLLIFEGAKQFVKDRFYWMNPNRTLAITGVGSVQTLIAEENRFQETEDLWKQALEHTWIDNPYSTVPATGFVAFGGMDFDPLEVKTELWKKFELSKFYIPELMWTTYQSHSYVTVNILIHKEETIEEAATRIRKNTEQFAAGKSFGGQPIRIRKNQVIAPEKWKETVKEATKEMKEKRAEKIVLAREVRLTFTEEVNITQVLEELHHTQANSYIFAFESEGDCFIGATPERMVKVEKNQLLSTCLAGTAPRGKTKAEDEQIGYELLHDKKNRDEHEFVVKMIKEAILKTCTDVNIPSKPVLHPLKNLQHLYTPVTGRLKESYSIFDVIKDLHPTPALGGTPTEESLAYIREHELLDRGWYGAPIGWIDSNQNGEFAVAIRCGLIQADAASLFAGCGVLADSDPEMEFEETRIKMLPMLHVLGGKQE
ncbi:isochorismate synthase [Oceanobacillus alkalisoli]|uniref:isochorismate synthase n=1 Tax=Oceanobacillus alkalisoli TaxID=2925113 RepID=UPI001EEFF081|nr:isochorismate synthase [Oceanobacillus alkalisoli]MCF3943482.1 isochorismate synthase [Oceanobacillus alkalisoli]MCG5104070.1 isochorismate synthase [Oceanobacillus alkalisoli]